MPVENPHFHELLLNQLWNHAKKGSEEDWRFIDEQLKPKLSELDGDKVALQLLDYSHNEDPNIRDLVATCLAEVEISHRHIVERIVDEMAEVALHDEEVFPAGRAATVLVHYQEDPDLSEVIQATLRKFSQRVKRKKWESDIRKYIPVLVEAEVI